MTQFYINFSRQKHQIDVSNVSFIAWDSQVSFVTPFHFSFKVPLSLNIVETYLDKNAILFKLNAPNTFIPGWFRACSRVLNVHCLFVNSLSNIISMHGMSNILDLNPNCWETPEQIFFSNQCIWIKINTISFLSLFHFSRILPLKT